MTDGYEEVAMTKIRFLGIDCVDCGEEFRGSYDDVRLALTVHGGVTGHCRISFAYENLGTRLDRM